MEQSQETKSNKNLHKTPTALISIVTFLVGAGICALLFLTVFNPCKDTTDKSKSQPGKADNAINYSTYKDLARRANIFIYGVDISDTFLVGYQPMVKFDELAKLPVDNKTASAYLYSDVELSDDQWQKATEAEENALCEALGADSEVCRGQASIIRDYDMTKIQETYKKLFGEELDMSAKSISLILYLNPIVYVPSQKALFTDFAAGGDIGTQSYNYINNITIEDTKAYVYFNLIVSDYPLGDYDAGINDYSKLVCYDNFDRVATNNCAYYFNTGVNEFNYKNLKNFRLVFEKDGDNFVYKTAEEVK